MLKLVDSYVLDALGVLDEQTRESLERMTPVFASSLGVEASTWQGIVEQAMALPPDSPAAIQGAWESAVREDLELGRTPDVEAFAHALVDQTFFAEDVPPAAP